MLTGICAERLWRKRFLVPEDCTFVLCTHCGYGNIADAATSRAAERDLPTPDPKMDAASPQTSDPATAFKSDSGKVRFELLEDGCPNALLLIAKVMTWAVEVKGYHAHSWREVPEASRRYRAALARHRNAIARGEVMDPESGYPHWAHVACCTIFLLELEIDHAQSV